MIGSALTLAAVDRSPGVLPPTVTVAHRSAFFSSSGRKTQNVVIVELPYWRLAFTPPLKRSLEQV